MPSRDNGFDVWCWMFVDAFPKSVPAGRRGSLPLQWFIRLSSAGSPD